MCLDMTWPADCFEIMVSVCAVFKLCGGGGLGAAVFSDCPGSEFPYFVSHVDTYSTYTCEFAYIETIHHA